MRPSNEDIPSEVEKTKIELLGHAMKGNWKEVVQTYKQKTGEAHEATISRCGDTALHMAISDHQAPTVRKLVSIVGVEALKRKNEHGNTPLHVAAYVGDATMCGWIAGKHPKLIDLRNDNHETPMFLAVVHGRKEAFLCMWRLVKDRPDEGLELCRSHEGRTILHSAISGEHFDLALKIIHMYPKLICRHDAQGINPLHLLATKPSAFKSGIRMGLLHTIVYQCIYIRKLLYKDENEAKNSQTFYGRIRSAFCCTNSRQQNDSENPNGSNKPIGSSDSDSDYFYCTEFRGIFKKIGTILTLGLNHKIGGIIEEKRKHIWTVQIMEALVEEMSPYEFEIVPPSRNGDQDSKKNGHDNSSDVRKIINPDDHVGNGGNNKDGKEEKITGDNNNDKKTGKMLKQNEKKETPLLIAAKHGIIEMVVFILNKYPVAVHNENIDGKNIVLLAVEYRQPHVYKFLHDQRVVAQTIFYKTDKDGNSALHLAALLANQRNWLIPGPALQMQWEIKWYEFVEKSMPPKFFMPYNKKDETPWEIFKESHKDLVKEAKEWLYKTSESCSVVAVLIATVAFTASATVPGGTEKGSPILAKQPAFNVFAIASLVALCFSIASVVMFMAFFTSKHREKDFGTNLPAKLLVELTSLLVSIAAVLVSFCAAHFFVIKDTFKYTAFSLYAATLFPVALYAFWQIPMYSELVMATWRRTPNRVYEQD